MRTTANPQRTSGPWRVDSQQPGIARFNDDPTTGVLAGTHAAFIVLACNAYDADQARIAELVAALRDARTTANELMLVVEDFLPNVGKCALQNYERLNTAMIAGAKNRAALQKVEA